MHARPSLPAAAAAAASLAATSVVHAATANVFPPVAPDTAIEFYHAGFDHYFITHNPVEIDNLDSGRTVGWTRTGRGFKVFPSQASGGPGVNPVCRFYIPPEHGDSHFFSASPVECADVLAKIPVDPNYSNYFYESPNAFYIALPDLITGACAANTIPVYRLWNQRADSNHRYTTDPGIKAAMIAKGYGAEGYGTWRRHVFDRRGVGRRAGARLRAVHVRARLRWRARDRQRVRQRRSGTVHRRQSGQPQPLHRCVAAGPLVRRRLARTGHGVHVRRRGHMDARGRADVALQRRHTGQRRQFRARVGSVGDHCAGRHGLPDRRWDSTTPAAGMRSW